MACGNKLLNLTLVAFTLLLAVPLCGTQVKTTTREGKNGKSLLRRIYDEDQRDRSDEAGDAKRREHVRRLIGEGKVETGEDYYYAAFIFQHGQTAPDYLYGHVLAMTSLSKGFKSAKWLCAATLDRYLRSMKQPQIFGTQFGSLYEGDDGLEPYDKKMVSDAQRALWCVAPYSTQVKILSDLKAGKEFRSTRICPLP